MRRRYGSETIREMVIAGEKIEIDVNSDGQFSARAGGEYHRADRMADLIPLLRRAVKRSTVEVSIPVTLLDYGRFIGTSWKREYRRENCNAIVFGYNRNRNEYRIRLEDGSVNTTDDEYRGGFIAKPLTPEQIAEYVRLKKAKESAESAYDEFERKYKYRELEKELKAAQAAAIDAVKEDEADVDDDPRPLVPKVRTKARRSNNADPR